MSGNLHSAAEIRATSIDLANNTKEASEEVKTLRHVAALIKHEIQSQQQMQQSSANYASVGSKGSNPFDE